MRLLRPLICAIASVTAAGCASTVSPDEHAAHHPAAISQTAGSGAVPVPGQMSAMDTQMKVMREMHEKMMNAKTPAERQALMAEHMKTMQEGMSMMKDMSAMPGMSGQMGAQHQMMEKRMEMMQTMMQMMMDQMPPAPAAPTVK